MEAVPAPTGFPAGPRETFEAALALHRLHRAKFLMGGSVREKAWEHPEALGGLGFFTVGANSALRGPRNDGRSQARPTTLPSIP
jgi:hypothetical protein